MSVKLLLGIGVPLIIIIVLLILSSVGSGFIVDEKPVSSISLKRIYDNAKGTTLLTVTVTNNYFLPRSYSLPELAACLYDSTKKVRGTSISAQWTASKTAVRPGADIILYPGEYSYYGDDAASSLDVPSNGQNTAYYYITYAYSHNIWMKYNKILLIKNTGITDYRFCQELNPQQVESAISIPIIDDLGYTCPYTTSLDCSYNGKDRNSNYCEYTYKEWIRAKCPNVVIR